MNTGRQPELVYRSLFENASLGIVVFSGNGHVIHANPAFATILGYQTVDEMIKQVKRIDMTVFVEPDCFNEISESLRTQAAVVVETRFRQASGSLIWVSISASVTQSQASDSQFIEAIISDITDHKTRELEVLESQRLSQQLIENTQEGYWLIGPDGATHDVNPAMCNLLQRGREEIVGRTIYDFVDEENANIFRDQLKLREKGHKGAYEIAFVMPDGTLKSCMNNATPIFDDDGNRVASIGLWKDITPLKEVQRNLELAKQHAEAASQAKSEFLANMSHEIRTPLNAVLGMAKIGLRDSKDFESRSTFQHIVNSGNHLLGVINQILDFSKIEANKMKIQPRPFQLHEEVESVARLLMDRAKNKNLDLRLQFDQQLPQWVIGDPQRLQQVLINLVANGIKFTEKGEVVILVSQENNRIVIEIIDTGIGMSSDELSLIFQPFEQLDSTATRIHGGTGLGLVITRKLVELMNGELEVGSKPQQGSNFTVRLPLPQTDRPAAVHKHAGSGKQSLEGIRILAAEDVEINRMILEDLLIAEGANVVFAENGQQILDQLQKYGADYFDIVLMDIQMPVMDGFESTRRLLELAPNMPVIGVTAHAFDEERQRCIDAGMLDHVAKPIEVDILIERILKHTGSQD